MSDEELAAAIAEAIKGAGVKQITLDYADDEWVMTVHQFGEWVVAAISRFANV